MTAPAWRLRRAGAEDPDALALVAGATFLEAFAGLVAPMMSRLRCTALSPSSTCTTTGPEIMKLTRSPKNGRSLWTA